MQPFVTCQSGTRHCSSSLASGAAWTQSGLITPTPGPVVIQLTPKRCQTIRHSHNNFNQVESVQILIECSVSLPISQSGVVVCFSTPPGFRGYSCPEHLARLPIRSSHCGINVEGNEQRCF